MKKYLDVLANCPLFEDIDNKDIGAMLGCLGGRLMDVKKNSVIFEEGAPAREFGIVLAGRLQVARTDIFGKRSIMLSVGAGELFGEAFACAEVNSCL